MRLFPIRHAPAPLQLRRRKGAGGSSAQHVLLYSELAVLLVRATMLLASARLGMARAARWQLPTTDWQPRARPRAAGSAISPPMSDIIVTAAVALAVTAFIITFAGLILAVVASVRETAERRRRQQRERRPWLYGRDPDLTNRRLPAPSRPSPSVYG